MKVVPLIPLTIAAICFILASDCRAASDSNLPYKEGELIVRFAPAAGGRQKTINERNQVLASFKTGAVKRSVRLVPGLSLVELPAGLKVKDALPKLRGNGQFLYVEPNYKLKFCSTFPNDPCFLYLWGLHNTGQMGGTPGADIDAPAAWDLTKYSNVIVAVIDTGVDYKHPDLAANMWKNPKEANGIPGVDDDNDGFVDDIYGWDFGENKADPNDNVYHGTHIAGIIGAVGNNGIGVTGTCWNVRIMAVKISDVNRNGWSYDAVEGINYAVQMGAKVLNCSWEYVGPTDPYLTDANALKDAIDAADACGVLLIAAAGNEEVNIDGLHQYPSSYNCRNIITVMATDHNDQMASFSNFGYNLVDLAAPGDRIFSTMPRFTTKAMYDPLNPDLYLSTYYETISGTSMSAPYVSGACALVWAANPFLTHMQVKEAVLQSVDRLDSLKELCATGGRLNLYNALSYWPLGLTITDNAAETNGASPYDPLLNNLLEYTICYDACGFADTNVVLRDYLPAEVNYNDSLPEGIYDSNTRTVTWPIGTMGPNDSGCFLLNVKVNSSAVPGVNIVSRFRLTGDNSVRQAFRRTPVDCFKVEITYVNKDAPVGGDGKSWQTAFNNLQTALAAIRSANLPCNKQLWVAKGTYKPANDVNYSATFAMIAGTDMYGHFKGWETGIDQRNLADANNDTILSGDVNGSSGDAYNVITAANARLDGFTIKKSSTHGIFCSGCSPTIANCVCKNNDSLSYGIYCQGGANVTITNTFVNNNSTGIYGSDPCTLIYIDKSTIGPNNTYGLYIGSSCTVNVTDSIFNGNQYNGIWVNSSSKLNLEGCDISDNGNPGYDGIYCTSGTVTGIRECTIRRNGSRGLLSQGNSVNAVLNIISNNTYDGVALSGSGSKRLISNLIYRNGNYGISAASPGEIRNNTIVYNSSKGITSGGSSNVNSNIIWGNTSGGLSSGFTNVNYNCIQGGKNYTGIGDVNADPCFVNSDANDYHLRRISPCIDAGDPNFSDANQTDIDGQNRVMDGNGDGTIRVDMGAYEYSPFDLWPDKVIDFLDFTVFARSWSTSQGDADYNDLCDFYRDGKIDFKDLDMLCTYWLMGSDWEGIGGQGAYFSSGNGDNFGRYDLSPDGVINFPDFTVFARSWASSQGSASYNDLCDFYNDGKIDYQDLSIFCAHWLWMKN